MTIGTLKKISHTLLSTTTTTLLYTIPALTKTVMKEVVLCNTDTVVRTVTMQAGPTTGLADRFLSAVVIQPGETKGIGLSTVLLPGDSITGGASLGGVVSCIISGVEQV